MKNDKIKFEGLLIASLLCGSIQAADLQKTPGGHFVIGSNSLAVAEVAQHADLLPIQPTTIHVRETATDESRLVFFQGGLRPTLFLWCPREQMVRRLYESTEDRVPILSLGEYKP